MIGIVGLQAPPVANTLLPAMYRLSTPWTLQLRSTTPFLSELDMRVVPI